MTTIRAYTTVEQSRKLAEVLPIESADMCYLQENGQAKTISPLKLSEILNVSKPQVISCWSLAALLDVFPKGTNISTPKPINELDYCCWNQYDEIYANNLVDACYEMILKLHELNLL